MARYTIKNWRTFQHYTGRRPPWIKLQRTILDDRNFQCLPIASKALAPMLWLLASESDDGSIECDPAELAWRLRWAEKDIKDGLTPLIKNGFLECASEALAECLQDACLETEGEGETEGDSLSGSQANSDAAHDPVEPKEPTPKAQARELIAFLNEKAGKAFRPVDANLEPIVARIKEGYTLQDLKTVTVRKCRQWGTDEKMVEYLRPATLYNRTNFNQYIGECVE